MKLYTILLGVFLSLLGTSCGLPSTLCKPGDCQQKCFETPDGPKCMCMPGFVLDGNRCRDVDECAGNVSVCDHYCKNTDGSFICHCYDDYILQKDGKTCKIDDSALFLFTLGTKLKASTMKHASTPKDNVGPTRNKKSWVVYHGDYKTSGLAYDPDSKKVYFIANRLVYRQDVFQGTKAEIFIEQGLGQPENLAIDYIAKNLYVTDYKHNHVLVCSLATEACRPILINLSQPRAIAVDIEHGHFYFSEIKESRISRANLDGTNRKIIVKDGLTWPSGLALDLPAHRIFWADAYEQMVESTDYDGKHRKHLPVSEVKLPMSLAVWEDRIYWTELVKEGSTKIHSCLKRDGKYKKVYFQDTFNDISNVAIYHSSMKTSLDHIKRSCNSMSSPCSHICLPTDSSYKCACPVEMELRNFNCIEKENNQLLVAAKSRVFFIRERMYGKNRVRELRSQGLNLKMAVDAELDPLLKRVFIADSHSEMIHILNSDGEAIGSLPQTANPIAIAIDWLRDNIYWINGRKHSVEVARMDGSFRKNLYNEFLLLDIALAIEEGYLFISRKGIFAGIKKCNIDATNCEDIISKDIRKPTSIATEPISKKIYWTDYHYKKIESADYDGKNRWTLVENVKNILLSPLKLYVTKDRFFWTEKQSKILNWMTMDNLTYAHSLTLDIDEPSHGEWFMNLVLPEDAPDLENLCHDKCHQLCFYTKYDKKCACADGLELAEDGSTCAPKGCEADEFQCRDGSCIYKRFKCDRFPDCSDGTDEDNCTVECSADQFACLDGVKCIDNKDTCDSFIDCNDHSDEDREKCKKNECKSSLDFRCDSGICIPIEWRCDQIPQCEDGSDENDCLSNECNSKTEFSCISGQCLKNSWVCDGEEDCPGGEDEQKCSACTFGQFRCDDRTCISEEARCDGIPQCPDKSDEAEKLCKDVHYHYLCPTNQRLCEKSKDCKICIESSEWCNGEKECPDGEDEDSCKVDCRAGDVACADGSRCILKGWVCDGNFDCMDKSDETNCTKVTTAQTEETSDCRDNEYQCVDGRCIPRQYLCNGLIDCDFGDDESKECDKCDNDNGGCQHICLRDVERVSCKCRTGFKLASDGVSCLDINECEDEFVCDHECVNIKGGYTCKCQEGYQLLDGFKCKAQNGKHWNLVLEQKGKLRYIGLEYSWYVGDLEVLKPLMTYDPLREEFYILDSKKGILLKQLEEKWSSVLQGIENANGVDLDYINRNVYISESSTIDHGEEAGIHLYSDIKACNLDTGACQKVKEIHNENITALAIATTYRRLFYCTTTLESGKVIGVSLDGKKEAFAEDEKVVECSSIAVNEGRKRIYWIDQRLSTIESISFTGHGRHRLKFDKVQQAYGLSLIDHGLAWMNRQRNTLVKCNLVSTQACREIYIGYGDLLGSIPPYGKNVSSPCKQSPCPLDQMCLPHSEFIPTCLCPKNLKFEMGSDCLDSRVHGSLHGSSPNDPCHSGKCTYSSPGHIECRCPDDRIGKSREIQMQIDTNYSNGVIIAGVVIFTLIGISFCAFGFLYKKDPSRFSSLKIWKKSSPPRRFRFSQTLQGILQEENDKALDTPSVNENWNETSRL